MGSEGVRLPHRSFSMSSLLHSAVAAAAGRKTPTPPSDATDVSKIPDESGYGSDSSSSASSAKTHGFAIEKKKGDGGKWMSSTEDNRTDEEKMGKAGLLPPTSRLALSSTSIHHAETGRCWRVATAYTDTRVPCMVRNSKLARHPRFLPWLNRPRFATTWLFALFVFVIHFPFSDFPHPGTSPESFVPEPCESHEPCWPIPLVSSCQRKWPFMFMIRPRIGDTWYCHCVRRGRKIGRKKSSVL